MKKFLSINDIEICVDDTEHGENSLLLIHGLTGDKSTMYPIRDMFKDEYRVITVDTRGHGESTRPENYTLDDHAIDIHGIIQELNLEKADILGYSMGSYIALRAAEVKCDDINNLILVCTKPNGKTSSVARILKEANLDITQVTQEEMMGVILKASVAPQSFEKIVSGELDVEGLLKGDGQELSEEEKAAEDASLANFDNSKDYDNVACSTLVIGAEYDGINPPELGREVADGIKDAKFELIKDAGHLAVIEKPDEFQNIVRDFLND
ncbi:MAG: alpha/beta hydrolase [Methanobrevibacter sp.]|uniref:alpha/beta fold hydrolase n=1 Tax=Methanobrevibacter sp. TaxID=66852 RepID=UPI0025E86645|nr:alpha/beta hydrolase [Methanobrevibacter sp.]MBE6508000.1 alpha/beta hydrolase [Methanobrevibacter sp.]